MIKATSPRIVKVVSEGHAMTSRDLEDLVLAVAVECCPLYALWATLGPVEVGDLAAMFDSESASCAWNMLASVCHYSLGGVQMLD